MASYFKDLISVIFPPKCVVCAKKLKNQNEIICKGCFGKIITNNCFYCPKCGKRLYEPKKQCHPKINFVLSATTSYQNESIRKLIHFFKYKNFLEIKNIFNEIFKEYLKKISFTETPELIIPIPLYKRKRDKRGFNQTEILAEELQKLIPNAKIEKEILLKVKNTKSQTECKNFEAREKNISGCFVVKNQYMVKNKNLIIVDDVFTSGATMKEAAKKLKEAGAKKIIAFVIAKA